MSIEQGSLHILKAQQREEVLSEQIMLIAKYWTVLNLIKGLLFILINFW